MLDPLGRLPAFALGLLVAVTACSGAALIPGHAAVSRAPRAETGGYLKHVVIVVQENRTFDNLFAGFPGAASRMYGYNSKGQKIYLRPTVFRPGFDPDMVHNFENAVVAWHGGKMDRFDLTPFDGRKPAGRFPYSYLRHREIAPYWTIAKNYALADHMFPMEFGPSFTSHLALIMGNDSIQPQLAIANFPSGEPWGCDAYANVATSLVDQHRVVDQGKGPRPCFSQFRTIADVLDAGSISWKYYAPAVKTFDGGQLWSSFDAIKSVRYGPDWKSVVSPQTTILQDAANGTLPSVSWVVPDWLDSDHPAAMSDTGPSWVASVVNAIGKGPQWDSTVIFIVWDDWGGWYDDAPPPQLDFRGLGIRVPLLIVSPYVHQGSVDHEQYESASLLRFIEELFHLPRIGNPDAGYTDTRARFPAAVFDFAHPPRRFIPIPAKYPSTYFLHRRPSQKAPDNE